MDENIPMIRNSKVKKLSSTLKLMQEYPSMPLKDISEAFYVAFDELQIKDIIKSLEGLIKKNKDD